MISEPTPNVAARLADAARRRPEHPALVWDGGALTWRDLEARILSRLTEPEVIAWWDELDRWVRPALVAAAILLFATGVAMIRSYQAERESAYEAMLTPTSLPVETAVRPMRHGPDAAFRFLMSKPRQ